MQLQFDENRLLTIHNPNISPLREYVYQLSGLKVSGYDKGILVYHKKQWKILNFKNLGDGMLVSYLLPETFHIPSFQVAMLSNVLALFHGFDENSGDHYHFLPFFSKDIVAFQHLLTQNFGLTVNISKKSQGTIIEQLDYQFQLPQTFAEQLSFLYALVLVYGKWEGKDGELISAKIHLPLFAQWQSLSDSLNQILDHLSQYGIFLTAQLLTSANKIIFQISITDYDLLNIFADWMQTTMSPDLATFQTHFLNSRHLSLKNQLIDFITQDPALEMEGKPEVLKLLDEKAIKFLKY